MSTVDPHVQLEESYRRMLRWFPASYRRSRGRELVDVLMERADPGQRRPSPAECAALLRFSVRMWAWRAISPTPAAARDATGILAVLLPMMLLFPAAAELHVSALPLGADIPAWLLWCITAAMVVFGRSSWPRYTAVLGVAAYSVAIIVQYSNGNFLIVGNSLGLWAVQVVAAVALASPSRVDRGRQLIPAWRAGALGAAVAGLGVLLSTGEYRLPFIDSRVLLPVTTALATALGVAALFTAAGRALLPTVAALAGLILATKYLAAAHPWANGQPAETGNWSHISMSDVLLLIAAPVAVFLVVRVITAVANRLSRVAVPQGNPINR